jgi:hypothetical protein
LTLVVAVGLTRLAALIGGILILGMVLALPLYRRVEPGLLVLVAIALLAALAGRRSLSALRRPLARS